MCRTINQRFIYKRFCLNKLKSKGNLKLKLEEYLTERAPGNSESECVWRKSFWRWSHQKQVHQRQTHQKQMVSRSKDSSDTKKRWQRQCTKSTTTMPTFVPATTNSAQCLLYTTRITVTVAETFPYLREWIWIWFHCTSLKSSKGSRVSNQLR